MAKTAPVWGIEIGQSALKALRCTLDGDQVIADAFDYIEYPKLLSQQDSEPESMIHEALQTFVGRNQLKGTRVALSVPGQNGLAKFFKPPPVELKKMSDIVKYEARQQIPFDLKDVSWDYQLMPGSIVENGFALESEIGLFAMKSDAVNRVLQPLQRADIEVDILQLAPLSIYNAITYDRKLMEGESGAFDPEHPPKSVLILAMGTDATDLIVTNGYRLWQRSVPLGGNHFTRQLVKDLKLTFAKAEHLKRNALEAEDPKLVFQAMRPVFNDLVTEVQRSIGFYRSLHKKDEVGSILMMGNSVKLTGLPQYLSKQLALDVAVMDNFLRLSGDEVVAQPAFKDHAVSFAPVYGLCLQGLDRTALYTNLIPQEIFQERLVRAKKPWVVATAASLLLGMTAALLPAGNNYKKVHPSYWGAAVASSDQTKSQSEALIAEDDTQLKKLELLNLIGSEVGGNRDRRLLWMEILKALDQALDRPADYDPTNLPDPIKVPFNERETIYLTKVDSRYFTNLGPYELGTQTMYADDQRTRMGWLGLLKDESPASPEMEGADAAEAGEYGAMDDTGGYDSSDAFAASGEDVAGDAGWVFEVTGYHYHNDDKNGSKGYRTTGDEKQDFVLKRLVHRLETGSAKLPVINDRGEVEEIEFTFAELGISRPFIVGDGFFDQNHIIANPDYKPPMQENADGTPSSVVRPGISLGSLGSSSSSSSTGALQRPQDPNNPEWFAAPKYSFQLQFVWREKPLSARLEAKRKAAEEAAAKEAAESAQEGDDLAAN
ncbi:MAG: type IV pilus assembly protein PilM [Pirellulaceae bacterium]|nr:type IV pilus assembly protein PilM [Pirellulaceae bacterium]